MKETYDYRGHTIDLDLSDIVTAQRWTYFIDGRYCIQGATESSPIEAVRLRALFLAHQSIDFLDSVQSMNGSAGPRGQTIRPRDRDDAARFAPPDAASLARLRDVQRIA